MNSDNNIEEGAKFSEKPCAREIMDCKRVFTRMRVPAPNIDDAWQQFGRHANLDPQVTKRKNRRTLFIGFAAGIAASVAIYIGVYQMFIVPQIPHAVQVFSAQQNKNGVSLLYNSGRSFYLSSNKTNDALLAQGVKANKDSLVYAAPKTATRAETLVISIPRGKDYHVVLSDGTNVWLNADTKLIFPDHFIGARREVQLYGEAYFEVTKDKAHPFVVNNGFFSTMVLGTKFNMDTYDQSNANVVLVEGKVALESKKSKFIQTIVSGQRAQLNSSGQFNIQHVDTYAYIQWKDGYFYFNNVPLVEIMQELGRWYNVDIIIENPRIMHTRLHFVADRNQGLSEALQNLNIISNVHAIMNGNKIIIK
jgi:transmembrane sensor